MLLRVFNFSERLLNLKINVADDEPPETMRVGLHPLAAHTRSNLLIL